MNTWEHYKPLAYKTVHSSNTCISFPQMSHTMKENFTFHLQKEQDIQSFVNKVC